MFSSSLYAPLATLVAYAVAISAVPAASTTPSLTVKTSTSDLNADGLKNLKVTATAINMDGETLKLLDDPRGVLNPFPEDPFVITDLSGSHPSFNGATANHSPKDAAGLEDPSTFTVLAPGDSIDVTHDPFAAYNITQSVFIKRSNPSAYVDADGSPKHLYATVEDTTKIKLTGNPPVSVSRQIHRKGTLFHGCHDDEHDMVMDAIQVAERLAARAFDYLRFLRHDTPRYTTWFGRYDPSRKVTALNVFERMTRGDRFTGATYDCICDKMHRRVSHAYVDEAHPGRVWLCKSFWGLKEIHKALVILHEISRFAQNGGTKDLGFGREICMEYARNHPQAAVSNANNYMFFAFNPTRLA